MYSEHDGGGGGHYSDSEYTDEESHIHHGGHSSQHYSIEQGGYHAYSASAAASGGRGNVAGSGGSGGGGSQQSKEKRKRLAQACQSCRGKKIRCDGVRPTCGPCAKHDARCEYVVAQTKRRVPRNAAYVSGLESRIAQLESTLKPFVNSGLVQIPEVPQEQPLQGTATTTTGSVGPGMMMGAPGLDFGQQQQQHQHQHQQQTSLDVTNTLDPAALLASIWTSSRFGGQQQQQQVLPNISSPHPQKQLLYPMLQNPLITSLPSQSISASTGVLSGLTSGAGSNNTQFLGLSGMSTLASPQPFGPTTTAVAAAPATTDSTFASLLGQTLPPPASAQPQRQFSSSFDPSSLFSLSPAKDSQPSSVQPQQPHTESSDRAQMDSMSPSTGIAIAAVPTNAVPALFDAESLPLPEGYEELVELYILYVQPLLPILHIPSLRKSVSDGTVDKVLLYLICAAAVRFSTHPLYASEPNYASSDVFVSRIWPLIMQGFDDISLRRVQYSSLLAFVEYAAGRGTSCWLFMGNGIRTAQLLQLHLTDSEFDANEEANLPRNDWIDRESKRRVWWALFNADRKSCVASSLPFAIESCDSLVNLPTYDPEFDGEVPSFTNQLNERRAAIAAGRQLGKLTTIPAPVAYLSRLLSIAGNISRYANDRRRRGLTKAFLLLHLSLIKWLRSLPADLYFEDTSLSGVPFLKRRNQEHENKESHSNEKMDVDANAAGAADGDAVRPSNAPSALLGCRSYDKLLFGYTLQLVYYCCVIMLFRVAYIDQVTGRAHLSSMHATRGWTVCMSAAMSIVEVARDMFDIVDKRTTNFVKQQLQSRKDNQQQQQSQQARQRARRTAVSGATSSTMESITSGFHPVVHSFVPYALYTAATVHIENFKNIEWQDLISQDQSTNDVSFLYNVLNTTSKWWGAAEMYMNMLQKLHQLLHEESGNEPSIIDRLVIDDMPITPPTGLLDFVDTDEPSVTAASFGLEAAREMLLSTAGKSSAKFDSQKQQQEEDNEGSGRGMKRMRYSDDDGEPIGNNAQSMDWASSDDQVMQAVLQGSSDIRTATMAAQMELDSSTDHPSELMLDRQADGQGIPPSRPASHSSTTAASSLVATAFGIDTNSNSSNSSNSNSNIGANAAAAHTREKVKLMSLPYDKSRPMRRHPRLSTGGIPEDTEAGSNLRSPSDKSASGAGSISLSPKSAITSTASQQKQPFFMPQPASTSTAAATSSAMPAMHHPVLQGPASRIEDILIPGAPASVTTGASNQSQQQAQQAQQPDARFWITNYDGAHRYAQDVDESALMVNLQSLLSDLPLQTPTTAEIPNQSAIPWATSTAQQQQQQQQQQPTSLMSIGDLSLAASRPIATPGATRSGGLSTANVGIPSNLTFEQQIKLIQMQHQIQQQQRLVAAGLSAPYGAMDAFQAAIMSETPYQFLQNQQQLQQQVQQQQLQQQQLQQRLNQMQTQVTQMQQLPTQTSYLQSQQAQQQAQAQQQQPVPLSSSDLPVDFLNMIGIGSF